MDEFIALMSSPHAEGRDGIHLAAQLRIDAMQLEGYRVGWAAGTMNTAAERISELEDKMVRAMKACKEALDLLTRLRGDGYEFGATEESLRAVCD
jgi:hypothetical protein